MSNKTEYLSYRGGCGMHGNNVLRQLTKELAWATDNVSVIMLFKTVIPLRN